MNAAGFLTMAFLTLYNADLGETQLDDPVPFPPAPPNDYNIRAICDFGNYRPKYPPSSIPSSWSSHFRRRAKAINLLESWYQLCCGRGLDQHWTVYCAQASWKEALSQFCVGETSVKAAVYDCCRPGTDQWKWQCFSTDTFNPSYGPVMG